MHKSTSLRIVGALHDQTESKIKMIRKQNQIKNPTISLMHAILEGVSRQTKSQIRDAENRFNGGQAVQNITKTINWTENHGGYKTLKINANTGSVVNDKEESV